MLTPSQACQNSWFALMMMNAKTFHTGARQFSPMPSTGWLLPSSLSSHHIPFGPKRWDCWTPIYHHPPLCFTLPVGGPCKAVQAPNYWSHKRISKLPSLGNIYWFHSVNFIHFFKTWEKPLALLWEKSGKYRNNLDLSNKSNMPSTSPEANVYH